MASLADIEAAIPALAGTNYSEESRATEEYNCIAYAFGDTKNPWWPKAKGYGYYWPPGFAANDSVDTLKTIFRVHGYFDCDSNEHEIGYEKVAIYGRNGKFLHAARQLQSGRWASKLGDEQDIEHEHAEHVMGDAYGEDIHIMRKKRKDWE
jgi:hypothetical protein